METIRRRNKVNDACNENWRQDDQTIMNGAIHRINCTPPYWKTEGAVKLQRPVCTKMQELREFYRPTGKLVIKSCRHISKLSSVEISYPSKYYHDRLNSSLANNHFFVVINFPTPLFREIKLVRSFDSQTLIGNIGGYIGLCLGYTILQIPSFIHTLYTKCCQVCARKSV